jgi:hypothetical protein
MYKDKPAYKQLNDFEKVVFRNMYEKLLFNEQITLSDAQLSKYYHLTISQWEKLLKKFCDNELLERNNIKSRENGKWKTIARQIKLSSKTFTYSSLNDMQDQLVKVKEMVSKLEAQNGYLDENTQVHKGS